MTIHYDRNETYEHDTGKRKINAEKRKRVWGLVIRISENQYFFSSLSFLNNSKYPTKVAS